MDMETKWDKMEVTMEEIMFYVEVWEVEGWRMLEPRMLARQEGEEKEECKSAREMGLSGRMLTYQYHLGSN